MGIAETLAMVAALIALLMVIHVWWKSAVERRTKLRDLCIFSGIILLISVYELVAHGGLTAYRDEMPLHYFRWASGHDPADLAAVSGTDSHPHDRLLPHEANHPGGLRNKNQPHRIHTMGLVLQSAASNFRYVGAPPLISPS